MYAALERMLLGFGTFLHLAAQHHPAILTLSTLFPLSVYVGMYHLKKQISIKEDNFLRFVNCKKCCKIFAEQEVPQDLRCFCGHSLWRKLRKKTGTVSFKADLTYSVKPLESALEDFLMQPGIEGRHVQILVLSPENGD